MALEFRRTGDADYPRHLNILLQGPPKSGKTTFLTTAPNLVIGAVEAGLMSIAHKNVAFVNIDSTNKLKELHVVLKDDNLRKQAATQLGLPDIETFAIDTLDAWQDMMKKEILKEAHRTDFQQADWGTLKERMATIIKAFVALPINVIFTVHTQSTQDDEKKMIYAPALQGGIRDEIAGYVDFSLLAERVPGVNNQGKQVIKYVLKNEGDAKNPHLGNRAAGRVPPLSEPDFGLLRDAVFAGVPTNTNSEVVAIEVPVTGKASGPVAGTKTAQKASQGKVTTAPAKPDDGDPINANGITAVKKAYTEQNLAVPEDLKTWNLGKARGIIRYFSGWKAKLAAGQENVTLDDLIDHLKAESAYAGEAPAKTQDAAPKAAKTSTASAPTPEPAVEEEAVTTQADSTDDSVTEVTEEQALETIKEAFPGAQVLHREIKEGDPCEYEGADHGIDDVEVAQLSLTRFGKATCFADYKKLAAAASK